jgi:enamine deaminase RidA (YjgF/YER057c/UK114 family)
MDVPGNEGRRVQEVENALSRQAEVSGGATGQKKPISLRLTAQQRADVNAAAKQAGMTMTDYIKARIFATPTRDRTQLAVIDGLHVAGVALLAMLGRSERTSAPRTEAETLVAEMRTLVEKLARDIG